MGIVSEAICNSESAYNGLVGPGMFCAGSLFGGRGACQVKDTYSKALLVKITFIKCYSLCRATWAVV